MRNSYRASVLFIVGIGLASPAKAYLIDDAKQYPAGTTEAEIRARFADAKATPISFSNQSGMSGVMYLSLPGRPAFEFCNKTLAAAWTVHNGGDLIQFRHLVEENSLLLGEARIRIEGRTDLIGKEWTELSAIWRLSSDRVGIVEIIEYAGQTMLVEQKIEDEHRCIR